MSEENAWKEKYLSDTRTTERLVKLALKEEDEDERWELVCVLHCRANQEVFEAAKYLCTSINPKVRALGADILGKLRDSEKNFPDESLKVLLEAINKETDVEALAAVVYAIGHSKDRRAFKKLLELKIHPNEDIRYAVVHGLLMREDRGAIDALIELSKDEDEDVRNWATFGLGSQIDADTTEIREALFQRLSEKGSETRDDIRGEALKGLAKRKDERVIEPLLKELERDDVGNLILDAAEEFADQRLLPSLLRLKEIWADNEEVPDFERVCLEDAILACQNKD